MDTPYQSDLGPTAATGRHVSWLRKLVNIAGCILSLPVYWIMTTACQYPVTLDLIVTVALTELNRLINERRRRKFHEQESRPYEKILSEKIDLELQRATPRLDCMAAVVGWREDPTLFTRALQSYKYAKGCVFLLVGIDGDETADEDMVNVFDQVYPQRSKTIHIPEPLGEVAEHVMAKIMAIRKQSGHQVDEAECHQIAIRHCIQLASTILEQQKVQFYGPNRVQQLCLRQRHMHKKGIMFTTFVFSLVIADMLGVEFLWSSDSDTLVLPDSLERSVDSIAADPKIGGASSGLIVHNEDETAVTSLASTVYWGELYLTRSSPAAAATSDCQSGPSSVFRLAALPAILVPWYMQTIFGKRMIINEDRHLTTNLLSRGWGVVFASDVLTATDTPTTLARWIKQQVRWARATHVEAILHPRVYAMNNPLLFFGMAKREAGPVIAATAVLYYLITSKKLVDISWFDVALRCLVGAGYNILRNPQRLGKHSLRWIIPGMFFYHIPLPAVHVWSLLTLTADGWGTTMRASSELRSKESTRQAWWETGFFVVWMAIVSGAIARLLATHYGLDWAHTMVVMSLISFLASFGAWKTTIHKIP